MARSCGIRRIPMHYAKYWGFFTRNAVAATEQWRPNHLCRFRGKQVIAGQRGAAMSEANIQDAVKQKYGEAAKQAAAGGVASCGGGGELSCCDPVTRDLYDSTQIAGLPEKAVAASLGCGNPTALAQLPTGETVLELGAGGGVDGLP